ncbi:translational activator for mitochondrial COX1 [Oleoguttula sp. CCFEE 5521]
MRQNAYCPHPEHQPTHLPSSPRAAATSTLPPAHVRHECPDCGIPVACSEAHFADTYDQHLEICDLLRQINEDDHDLHSGRFFPEFEYPDASIEEAQINMQNWDTLLFTREFTAVNDERSMRQVTRLLTYPITIGSILHELSPYSIKRNGRLTSEGLRSLSALRYTLHPPRTGAGITIAGLRPNPPPVRLFILGARAESSLPREVWLQLSHLFPRVAFHLIFIGPEALANRPDDVAPPPTPGNPFSAVVEDRLGGQMKISTYATVFEALHQAQHFAPYDPYFDAFVLFHPGLGHPASSASWAPTLPILLDTKIPVICTGYTEFDMQRDIDWVKEQGGGEVDFLLEPGENRFRSLRWEVNDLDPGDVSAGNWGVWGFRGKRYEADRYEEKRATQLKRMKIPNGRSLVNDPPYLVTSAESLVAAQHYITFPAAEHRLCETSLRLHFPRASREYISPSPYPSCRHTNPHPNPLKHPHLFPSRRRLRETDEALRLRDPGQYAQIIGP